MSEQADNKTIALQTEDEILDGILDKAGVTTEKSFYGEDGKMQPSITSMIPKEVKETKKPEDGSETVVESKEEKPDSSEKTTRPQDSSPELKAAYKALRRDGVPYNLLDQMSKDNPEELLEWANKAKKRQEDVDARLGNKPEETSESNKANEDTSTTQEISDTDVDKSNDDTINDLKEHLGEEASEPLLRLNTQLKQQNEQLQTQMLALQEVQLQESLAISERVLTDIWPDLSTNRDSIHKKMAQLGKDHPNQFNSIQQMMYTAASEILGQPKNQESANKQPNQSAAEPDPRDVGQPAKNSGGNMPPVTLSSGDRENAALDAILDGKGVEEAKRAYMQS